MLLLMSSFVVEGVGQVTCGDIKVRIGDATSTKVQGRAWDALGKEYEVELVYANHGGAKSLNSPNAGKEEFSLWLYDRKGSPHIEINALSSQSTVLSVYDVQGKNIYQQKILLEKGFNSISPQMENVLPAGLYVFHVQLMERSLVGKWIKK